MDIKLSHVTKIFPARKKEEKDVIAVNDVDITIPNGKLVGLLGPSGCGKSTTLYMISGLESPTKGNIFFGETDVTKLPAEKRGIGLVFQNYALYPHMTVRDNVMFPLLNMKMAKKEAKEKAYDICRLVQISDLMDRKPHELSGGQMQRVAIARALVKMPNVLLLDEPLSNLDARLRLQTREEIKRIQKETKITTVFVTHDQEEAMSICDIMIVMKDGFIQQVGVPQEIYSNPANLFVATFIGMPRINVLEGKILNHKLMIDEEIIMDVAIKDQDVYVGIRPEAFIYAPEGVLSLDVDHIELMGREKTVIARHSSSTNEIIRAIIPIETIIPTTAKRLAFNLKKSAVYIFSKETGNRLRETDDDTNEDNDYILEQDHNLNEVYYDRDVSEEYKMLEIDSFENNKEYYELVDGNYVLTNDHICNLNKTYYYIKKNISYIKTQDNPLLDDKDYYIRRTTKDGAYVHGKDYDSKNDEDVTLSYNELVSFKEDK